jgi:hypothetical protein
MEEDNKTAPQVVVDVVVSEEQLLSKSEVEDAGEAGQKV